MPSFPLSYSETLAPLPSTLTLTHLLCITLQIAILRTQGKLVDTISALNAYLTNFSSDENAWGELASVYIQLGEIKQACFCYEELILISPLNSVYLMRYAELLYTLGGLDNIRNARACYAQAVENAGDSLRALYGMVTCCTALTPLLEKKKEESSDNAQLLQFAHKRLEKLGGVVKFAIAAYSTAN